MSVYQQIRKEKNQDPTQTCVQVETQTKPLAPIAITFRQDPKDLHAANKVIKSRSCGQWMAGHPPVGKCCSRAVRMARKVSFIAAGPQCGVWQKDMAWRGIPPNEWREGQAR